jgi:hypothetical protein
MVRQAHHDRLGLPLVLSSSKDALRSRRLSPDLVQEVKVFEAKKRFGLAVLNYTVTSTTSIFWSKTRAQRLLAPVKMLFDAFKFLQHKAFYSFFCFEII